MLGKIIIYGCSIIILFFVYVIIGRISAVLQNFTNIRFGSDLIHFFLHGETIGYNQDNTVELIKQQSNQTKFTKLMYRQIKLWSTNFDQSIKTMEREQQNPNYEPWNTFVEKVKHEGSNYRKVVQDIYKFYYLEKKINTDTIMVLLRSKYEKQADYEQKLAVNLAGFINNYNISRIKFRNIILQFQNVCMNVNALYAEAGENKINMDDMIKSSHKGMSTGKTAAVVGTPTAACASSFVFPPSAPFVCGLSYILAGGYYVYDRVWSEPQNRADYKIMGDRFDASQEILQKFIATLNEKAAHMDVVMHLLEEFYRDIKQLKPQSHAEFIRKLIGGAEQLNVYCKNNLMDIKRIKN